VRVDLGGQRAENTPRDRPFTAKLADHLEERVFGIDKLEHALEIYVSTEEVGVDELAGGEERALLVEEACDGARDRGKGVVVHDSEDGALLWLRTDGYVKTAIITSPTHCSMPPQERRCAHFAGNMGTGSRADIGCRRCSPHSCRQIRIRCMHKFRAEHAQQCVPQRRQLPVGFWPWCVGTDSAMQVHKRGVCACHLHRLGAVHDRRQTKSVRKRDER